MNYGIKTACYETAFVWRSVSTNYKSRKSLNEFKTKLQE